MMTYINQRFTARKNKASCLAQNPVVFYEYCWTISFKNNVSSFVGVFMVHEPEASLAFDNFKGTDQ